MDVQKHAYLLPHKNDPAVQTFLDTHGMEVFVHRMKTGKEFGALCEFMDGHREWVPEKDPRFALVFHTYYNELTVKQNHIIWLARHMGFAAFYPACPDAKAQAELTHQGAWAHLNAPLCRVDFYKFEIKMLKNALKWGKLSKEEEENLHFMEEKLRDWATD